MAFFNGKQNVKGSGYIPLPIPEEPSFNPPDIPEQESGSEVNIPVPTFDGNATITLYRSSDEAIAMDKRLSDSIEFDIIIKEETSVLEPNIVLQSNTDLTFYNYCYIDITDRYYFADITLYENGFFLLKLKVDVLMSHKVGIRKLIGLVERTEDDVYSNYDFEDDMKKVQRGTTTKIVKYSKSLEEQPRSVLITAGVYSAEPEE